MNRFAVACVAGIALFSLGSCSTVENVRIIQQTKSYNDGEFIVKAAFLDEATLIGRYGLRNPFLPPPRLLTPIDFLVIEIVINAPADYGFVRSRDIRLKFNDVKASPVAINRLLAIWESEIDVRGDGVVGGNYRNLVRRLVVPRDVTGRTIGLLIFQGNFPLEGNAILSIPHLSPELSQISELKSARDSNNNPIEPVFDGELIHFNFAIRHEEREVNFFGF